MWYASMWCACFQPRKKLPRQSPGQLFYPAEQSHVFEKYWDHLENLEEHPEFCHESEFTQGCMRRFSSALSRLDFTDFTPRASAEAKQSDLRTVEDMAISRLRPTQDGPDMRVLHRSSADTVQATSRGAETYTMLLFNQEVSSRHEEIRLGTTLYQQGNSRTRRVRRCASSSTRPSRTH
jgi:hypothetical protein